MVLFFVFCTIFKFRPKEKEKIDVPRNERVLNLDDELTIVSYNTGYAGLSEKEDFFMDGGINGDAQRIEQMVWMRFLKVYDAKEDDWELNEDNYVSIIPEELTLPQWIFAP